MPDPEEVPTEEGRLRRVITVRHAVAIYVSSVLGAGILVIPGLAARIAGPGSLVAWVILSGASYPFAYTFSRLSARRPESGGIYSFARECFGKEMAAVTAWLFVAWDVLGAPAATIAAASYLAYSFPMPREEVFAIAILLVLSGFVINYQGIRLSGRVQLATVVCIVAVLAVAVLASVQKTNPAEFTPFLPGGFASVGVASALIIWTYFGYENVSNVAEEFKNPARDFGRSVVISVLLISALYLAVAFAVVGTGVYKSGGGVTPFAAIMSGVFGTYGGVVVSLLAVFITFGTVNAYTAGMSRVVFAAARDGSLPRALATIDRTTGAPRRSLVALTAGILIGFLFYYLLGVDLETGFLATSGAAILAYVIGSAAGIRLLHEGGARRILPWVSLVVSLAILPFIGILLIPSLLVVGTGLLYSWYRTRTRKAKESITTAIS
jgi:amino acid efflux transporter